MWLVAAVAGALVVVTGLLPLEVATDVLAQVAPVLVFLVGVTALAELADLAGVFDAAAHEVGLWGRRSTARLWLLVVVLASVTTVLLSLDTTAVLLTPVVLAMCQRVELPALPFAMAVVWCANTASLLLPVSNLTNLLTQQRTGVSALEFASWMWPPAIVGVVVTALVLGLRYRRLLSGRYGHADPPHVKDKVLFWVAAALCLAIGPLSLVGVPVAWSAIVAAAVLVLVHVARNGPRQLSVALVPWRLVLLVCGLFLAVAAAHRHGLDALLADLVGQGTSGWDLLRLSGSSAVASNLVNNLPAYAALEPVAGTGVRSYALLVGVNLGPLVLLWGSLATLLWRDRCRARGIDVSAREFAIAGVIGVPALVVAATAALAVGR
jgi:arsenical pump membrane protein